MINIERIVIYVVVIALGLILAAAYFLPGGSFEKAKGAFDKTKSYLPDVGIGAQQVQANNPSISQEHHQELTSLKDAIQQTLYSEKRNCFSSYQSFSELGKKGTVVDFEYDAVEGSTHVVIRGGAGGNQVITGENFNIIGMKPCVIAGASTVVDNFDHAFLNNEKEVASSYFTDVNFIRIAYDDPWFGGNENRIAFGDSPEQLSQYYDFEGDGWLFTPDNIIGNKHICFFPTTDGIDRCAARGGVLDDNCFTRNVAVVGQAITDEQIAARAETRLPTKEISIPNLIAEGSLNQC